MRLRSFLALAVALALLPASPALAQEQIVAPPGNAGVEEYLEVVPSAGGDRPARPRGGGGNTPLTPSQALGSEEARALQRLSPDGADAAAVAAAGAVSDRRTTRLRAKDDVLRGSKDGASIASVEGRARADVIVDALGGSGGGMGLAFPLLLAGSVAAAFALIGVRRFTQRG